jgi:NAD(P)H-flavin reductase
MDDHEYENEFYETKKPIESYYYRGSVAVPYQVDHNGVVVAKEESVVSPAKRYMTTKLQFGKALLTTSHPVKAAKNPALNFFSMLSNYRIPRTQFSALDLLIASVFVVINCLFFVFINYFPGMYAGVMWGYLASANSLLVALPATRNSVLVWLLGVPFDKTIMYHRWIGRLVLIQASIHFAYYPISTANDFPVNQWNYGVAAWAMLLVLFLTSIGWIRRHHFNFFFNSHFIFIAYYVIGALHSPKSFVYMAYASATVYGFDRLVRFFWGMFPSQTIRMEVIGGAVRVIFKKHFAAKYSVGEYVFINFPQLSLLEWHPYTLASGPDERYCEVMIKGLGDHTKALLSAAESNQRLWIRVDGPYGKWPYNFSRFRSILLVAGGVGVTPSMALIRHVYHINRDSNEVDPYLQDVFFVWSCKNEKEFGWYRDILEEAMARSAVENSRFPKLHAYVHITRPESDASSLKDLPSYIKSGRPDLHQVFDRIVEVGVQRKYASLRTAVVACGPEAMVTESWDQASQRTKGNTRFDFHHETFEF